MKWVTALSISRQILDVSVPGLTGRPFLGFWSVKPKTNYYIKQDFTARKLLAKVLTVTVLKWRFAAFGLIKLILMADGNIRSFLARLFLMTWTYFFYYRVSSYKP